MSHVRLLVELYEGLKYWPNPKSIMQMQVKVYGTLPDPETAERVMFTF